MSIATEQIELDARVPDELGAQRLDQVAAQLFDDYSRSRLTGWIRDGSLTVDGQKLRPRDIVYGGALLQLKAVQEAQGEWLAQEMPLDIVYEDEHLLVINKPAGLVVHPAAGHASGTLLNGLLHYVPQVRDIPRAGIVHRLDKDTSGIMVVAKSLLAHTRLVEQLQAVPMKPLFVAWLLPAVPLMRPLAGIRSSGKKWRLPRAASRRSVISG